MATRLHGGPGPQRNHFQASLEGLVKRAVCLHGDDMDRQAGFKADQLLQMVVCVCVGACVGACVRACVRAWWLGGRVAGWVGGRRCVCVCVRTCVRVRLRVGVCGCVPSTLLETQRARVSHELDISVFKQDVC